MKSLRRTFRTQSTKYSSSQGAAKRQMSLEDDAVETGEHGDDQAGKLGDEARQRLHGVLLRKGLVQTLFWRRTPFLLILFGCGYAALGQR